MGFSMFSRFCGELLLRPPRAIRVGKVPTNGVFHCKSASQKVRRKEAGAAHDRISWATGFAGLKGFAFRVSGLGFRD